MSTPFDAVIDAVRVAGYYNQRLEEHSDLVSKGILNDLLRLCPRIAEDANGGRVGHWFNVPAPGARNRRIDLFVGEPGQSGRPDITRARICVENKSVMTAHRNKTNRLDDLGETLRAIHAASPEAVVVATVLVGTADRVLNVPDHVKKHYKKDPERFEREVMPRLSSGDNTLWDEFDYAVSANRPDDPAKTIQAFRTLPTRSPGHTHVLGYDFVLLVPVFIDNVNLPTVCYENAFGIDIKADYERMLATVCRAYEARWHL